MDWGVSTPVIRSRFFSSSTSAPYMVGVAVGVDEDPSSAPETSR